MAQYVKFEMPEEAYEKVKTTLQKVLKTKGKIKPGVNEVTKMLERGKANLVVIAEDVSPEELVLHIPVLAEEKKVPFLYYKDKKALGELIGLKTKASCVVVISEGQAKKELDALKKMFEELKK